MAKPEIVEGVFLRLDPATVTTLCAVMEREGYTGDLDGVACFLSDVAGGKLDSDEEATESVKGQDVEGILGVLGGLARKHGPTLAKAGAAFVRSRKGGL